MNNPYKESTINKIKNEFLNPTLDKNRKSDKKEEKKWEEIGTGPNCL